jgi:tRNA uridine 5-carboxymethylaminomethyl modification enzyme
MPDTAGVRLSLECDVKYSGFLAREQAAACRIALLEQAAIPEEFDYRKITGLLTESVNKLIAVRPSSLGQASRISGVTPADISLLALHLTKKTARTPMVPDETATIREERETI